MPVRRTLQLALDSLAQPAGADLQAITEAKRWLARTEVLLEWIAKHPKLVEINCEAALLVTRYRGSATENSPLAVSSSHP